MARKKKSKKKSDHHGKIFVGVSGEGNSICAVKIRKTKNGAELLDAKQFTLENSLDSIELTSEVFGEIETIEPAENGSIDVSMDEEDMSLMGLDSEDEDSKDDSGIFLDILKMAEERGSKMALSVAEPQVFYNVFDSDWNLKGKKLEKKVLAELATLKEEYVTLKNDSYNLIRLSEDRPMAIVREGELAMIHHMDNVKSYIGNRLPFISFIESTEISLVNLVLQSYDLAENELSLILHVGPETSHFLFLKGKEILNISQTIATGFNSDNVGGTLSSRLLFEFDSLNIQRVDNIFMTGYAARTGIKDFLYDNFQREVKIKLVKIAGLDIKNFEENLPADLSFDLKNMENRDPVKNIFKTNDDNIPDLEYEIESMNNEALGDVVNDEVKPYFPPEKEEESKDDMSLQEELAAELGIEIKEDEEERQADNSINGEKQESVIDYSPDSSKAFEIKSEEENDEFKPVAEEKQDSSSEVSDEAKVDELVFTSVDIELAIYAPAIGVALRAAGLCTGPNTLSVDLTPSSVKEGQNRLMISTPGWIMMFLIPLIGAYTFWQVDQYASTVSDLKWQLIPLREQINQYESVETSIREAENTLANFERSFSVIDSLIVGTDVWSTFLDRVMKVSNKLEGFWFIEMSTVPDGKVRLTGYSIYRNRIPKFIEKLGSATLKRVDVQEIRKKTVYRFEIEASLKTE